MLRPLCATALTLLATAFPLATSAAPAVPATAVIGTWMNPYGSVAVRTGACGDRLCGWIVWASAEAQNDARDGGTPRLIGTALLENYRPAGGGSWAGTVFVPDRGQHFYSIIEPLGTDAMKLKGCILHGLVCRSQVWRRVAETQHG